jgi:hypothetical protein
MRSDGLKIRGKKAPDFFRKCLTPLIFIGEHKNDENL